MALQASVCSFVETMHHGKTWKDRRRKLHRAPPPTVEERRKLQSGSTTVIGPTANCDRFNALPHCDNSCSYAFDNVCDDGGLGSSYDDCSVGSDCHDCGFYCMCADGLMWNAD